VKRVVFVLFFCSFIASLRAQAVRKYVNEYLHMGVGARAFGMGRAVVASTHDASSGYWNPAGLSDLQEQVQASTSVQNNF